jgi:hypothetical protein
MMQQRLNCALVVAGAFLLASGASAQSPHASPQGKANAAPEARGAGNGKGDDRKGDDKKGDGKKDDDKDKDDKKAADTKKGDDDKTKKDDADRGARREAERAALREELRATLHAPMDDAVREELRRHARRMARLARIKAVATEQKDNATVDRVGKLIDQENARDHKWLANFGAKAAADDMKGGAK